MKQFSENIATGIGIDADIVEKFLSYMTSIKLIKGGNLSEYGVSNDNLYILRSGLLRAFLPKPTGNLTLWFAFANHLIVNIWCYQYGEKSRITIEAAMDSELMCISKSELESLCNSDLEICNVVRKLFEYHAIETEKSNMSQWECENGMERYLAILKRHPELLQHIPLKDLASYLQLAPQSLSRIRSQIK